jgi:hypothetical protein
VLTEGHARVAYLAAHHLLDQTSLRIARRSLAREATPRHLCGGVCIVLTGRANGEQWLVGLRGDF